MIKQDILDLANELGFCTATIVPAEIPINSEYLKFCEENLCGNYQGNYACPPDCGTPEEMHRKLLSADLALVLQSRWDIPGYNTPEMLSAKYNHNAAVRRLRDTLLQEGMDVFAVGYGGCTLCDPCKRKENQSCAFPELRISCVSAYCVDATKLAEQCGMPFDWNPKKLYLFGMILFRSLPKTTNEKGTSF